MRTTIRLRWNGFRVPVTLGIAVGVAVGVGEALGVGAVIAATLKATTTTLPRLFSFPTTRCAAMPLDDHIKVDPCA
jgi:hypothetical protein